MKDSFKFIWESAKGERLELGSLPAKRLFYTWLLLWNHLCPEDQRVWYKGPTVFHRVSEDKLIESLKHCTVVLTAKQKELGPRMQEVFVSVTEACKNAVHI
jgi:hypothetical protein